jgi:hypothetical protein
MIEVGGFFGLLLLILVVYAIIKIAHSDARTLANVIWVVLLPCSRCSASSCGCSPAPRAEN